MNKEEVLSTLEIYLSLNAGDKRLVTSVKKSIDELFESYSAIIPLESLSVNELKQKREALVNGLNNKFIPEAIKPYKKDKIAKIEKRLEDLT